MFGVDYLTEEFWIMEDCAGLGTVFQSTTEVVTELGIHNMAARLQRWLLKTVRVIMPCCAFCIFHHVYIYI